MLLLLLLQPQQHLSLLAIGKLSLPAPFARSPPDVRRSQQLSFSPRIALAGVRAYVGPALSQLSLSVFLSSSFEQQALLAARC